MVFLDHLSRRNPYLAAIPFLPRGPPRKPKQSAHALWVGNLPPTTTVVGLKDYFSQDATSDIQSVFLISKSNCAFINYGTETACVSAVKRFHDSRFHGNRLVCRLKRGSTNATNIPKTVECTKYPVDDASETSRNDGGDDGLSAPVIVKSTTPASSQFKIHTTLSSQTAPANVAEKFFIVKSLTLQDLEASVRSGIWATQPHNESVLNRAYNEAESVYLIFSANKSGEYFGYARMASSISGEAASDRAPAFQAPVLNEGPKYITTPATETAPRGRIIDDSARGSIFWEAELSDEEGRPPQSQSKDRDGGRQDLGRPFKIEWISISRLPFYRTRGLRNPWNANREVKIARDGTELEPSIGKRLVQMFP